MGDLLETVLLTLGSIGGVAVVVAGLVKFFGERWADRLHERWKHNLERELEEFRSELSNRSQVLSQALASGSAGFMAAQDRRLEAIGALWKEVLDLREQYGRAQMIWNVYTPEEIAKLRDFNADFFAGIPRTFDAFMAVHPRDVAKSEEHRPFVGERFWLLFYIYRAVCGRLALRVSEGIERGRIPPWDRDLAGKDDGVIQLLGHVLSDEEVEYVRGQVIGGPRLALQLLENKMLADAEVKLSGSHAVDTWMAEGRRALEMLKGVNEATRAETAEA